MNPFVIFYSKCRPEHSEPGASAVGTAAAVWVSDRISGTIFEHPTDHY